MKLSKSCNKEGDPESPLRCVQDDIVILEWHKNEKADHFAAISFS